MVTLFSIQSMVTLFGRSMGRPSALDHTPCTVREGHQFTMRPTVSPGHVCSDQMACHLRCSRTCTLALWDPTRRTPGFMYIAHGLAHCN